MTPLLLRRTGAFLLAIVAFGLVACGGESLPLANAGKAGLQARTVDDLLTLAPEEIDIGTAGLVFSHDLDPEVDIEGLQRSLDILAGWLRDRITPEMSVTDQATVLIRLLAEERGYRASDDPWAPGAHDLASMMYSKRGNCVGLTTIYLALGERAGLQLSPVLAPRHVYAQLRSADEQVFIEPTTASYSTEGPPASLWFDSERQRDGDQYGRAISSESMLAQMIVSHCTELLRLGAEESTDRFETRAVALARHGLQLDPDHSVHWINVQYSLSRLARKQGIATDTEQLECLARARELEPDRAEYWTRSAEAFNRLDQWDTAIDYSERAIRLEPNMPTHSLPLAVALWGKQEFNLATDALHRARELSWTQIHPTRLSIISDQFEDRDAFDAQALRLLAEIYGDAADHIPRTNTNDSATQVDPHALLIAEKASRSLPATCLVLSEVIRTGDPTPAEQYLQLFGKDQSPGTAGRDLARLRTELQNRLAKLRLAAPESEPAGPSPN